MCTMITKILIAIFLVMFFVTESEVTAGPYVTYKYVELTNEEEARKIKRNECFWIMWHITKAQYRKNQGIPFEIEEKAAINELQKKGILTKGSEGSDREKLYTRLVKFAYDGGNPLHAQTKCMNEDPDYLATEIKDAIVKTLAN